MNIKKLPNTDFGYQEWLLNISKIIDKAKSHPETVTSLNKYDEEMNLLDQQEIALEKDIQNKIDP